MTVRETLAEGIALLAEPCPDSFIDTAALDAALLLGETLRYGREKLIAAGNETITEADRESFLRLVERRRSGECTAYILGRREFRGLEFSVNPHVLVPRPDSETLVEAALKWIDSRVGPFPPAPRSGFSLLDLCAGSGALAISLKNERPFLSVTASDISTEALDIAKRNAGRLLDKEPAGAPAVTFIKSDLFEHIRGKFNVIVSNPPYVPSDEIKNLAPEVQREPRLALDGGGDGLQLIRKIISRTPDYLLPNGRLFLEAGSKQMPLIRSLLENHGFRNIELYRDLAGRERVISGEV